MADFVMPTLGADMTAGKMIEWRKQPGDVVRRGDIIAEVETDKANIEVEVFLNGVIERLLVQPGEKVPVGTVLALIRETGAPTEVETLPVTPPVVPVLPPVAAPTVPAGIPPPISAEERRLRISPAARKLAADLGIDTAAVAGTGPGGRITMEDVQKAAETAKAPPSPAAPTEPPLDRAERMRQIIAAAMTRSKREIPHYYLSTTIDMSQVMTWLAAENEKRSIEDRLLYGVLLLKAVALALREVPELNAVWVGERAEPRQGIHVGVAIALRLGGLVAPALHDTDRLSLAELMHNFRDLVQRARAGTLRSSELSDPTITVTSLGEQGVETVFGVIYPPQVAIVGFGKVVERPWSVAGQVVSRPVMTATLSADHRVTDGHRGGRFLAAIDRLLQEPEKL